MTDIFGTIISSDQVEQAVLLTLDSWFKTYAREFEIQHSLPADALPLPRSFLTVDKVDRGNSDQLPSVVVVSPGLSGHKPQMEGDGSFRVSFTIGVGVFVGANDRNATTNLVRWYSAIVRAILIQHQSLGGFADGVIWTDESYDDNFQFTDNQTIGMGQVTFNVEVVDVVTRYGGPAYPIPPDPVTQPGSNWPTANTVTAVTKMKE